MWVATIAYAILDAIAFTLMSLSPTDKAGTPVGTLSDIATGITAVAVLDRRLDSCTHH